MAPQTAPPAKRSRSDWSVDSWKQKKVLQNPTWPDKQKLASCEKQLQGLPPLVHYSEVKKVRQLLCEVADGKRFLLQGGDCAERFDDCEPHRIEAKLKIILQMSLILSWAGGLPTLRIGRIAGQYPKPRSADTEKLPNGKVVPSFRGDCVNGDGENDRTPDPQRMVQSYFYSSSTLNYIRTLLSPTTGFADLHHARHWDLGFVAKPELRAKYEDMVDRLLSALDFAENCGILGEANTAARAVDFFTSHEGLLLPYESALTREDPSSGEMYNGSAHFLWIGDRTRQLDGAHIEFFRGVINPIGIKVGPTADAAEIVKLCETLNPNNEKGKIILISRMGHKQVRSHLPPIIKAIRASKVEVIWQCDSMHGNTFKTKNEATGEEFKTRNFDDIVNELVETYRVHEELGSRLMGLHFEMTGEDVTECLGGPQDLKSADLSRAYETGCDPRLNYMQAMEVAFRIAELLTENKHERRSMSRE